MPPNPSFADLTEALPFLAALAARGGRVYEVGGSVRDRFLGIAHKDHDLLVTGLALQALIELLRPHGEVFTVGKSFGVIKFHPAAHRDREYDIALPRREVSTGVGHRDFAVSYDEHLPVEADLGRRDFTINAMAVELATGDLIDPFQGRRDLERRTLRMVFGQAFTEDPLRLMRAIQFAARFHLKIDPPTLQAMREAAPLLKTVSGERVAMELKKLFLAEKPSVGFDLMLGTGLLKEVLPEIDGMVGVKQGNKLRNDDVYRHTMRVLDASRADAAIPSAGDLELMLAALFHDIGKPQTQRYDEAKERMTFYNHQLVSRRLAKKRMDALKITTLGVDPELVSTLVTEHMFQAKSFFSEQAIRRFIRKVGPDKILKLIDLRIADNRGGKYPEGIKGVLRLRQKVERELARKVPFSPKDLAVNGHDLMALGFRAGPALGTVLKALVDVVVDQPEKNERETLLALVKERFLPHENETEKKQSDR